MRSRPSDAQPEEPPDEASVTTDILRHVSEGISLTRVRDAVIVFANPYFERMFGYAPGELLGQHASVLNSPGKTDPEHVAGEIIAALQVHGRWEGELCNRRKDGSSFWSHASISTFDHAELGTVWISVQRDISERKRLEEQLVRAKSFLDSIVEHIPDMVFVKDATDLSFCLFNRAGEELLGYRRADLIGKNDYDFFPKAEADFFTEKDRAVLRDKTLLEIPEEAIETATHGLRLLHTKKIPILDDKGVPTYLLGISGP
jgi:PAS domain S-box-containing protein